MKRSILTPAQVAWLDATLHRNKTTFGGWSMTATPPEVEPPVPTPPAEGAPAEKPPWGDDFNPERAWHTITSLRAKEKELSAREVLTDDQKARLAEYDQLRAESQSELERAQEAASQVAPLTTENMRLRVALEKGLTGDKAGLIDRLQGSTIEELAADADKLLTMFGTPAGPAPTDPQPPKPHPAQGSSANGTPGVGQEAAQAAASGNWRESIRLKSQQLVEASEQGD